MGGVDDDAVRADRDSPSIAEVVFDGRAGVGFSSLIVSPDSALVLWDGAVSGGAGGGDSVRDVGGRAFGAGAGGGAAAGVSVRVAAGVVVGVRARADPGSEVVRERVAAGVLVPVSGTAPLEYEVGDSVLVRDANGELVTEPTGRVVVGATNGGEVGGPFGVVAFENVAVPGANGGCVPWPGVGLVIVAAGSRDAVLVRGGIRHVAHDTSA